MRKDRHHLKPKHRGGTDADGMVLVTKTQHAMFHFCEWKLHGLKEDFIAWKALCGNLKAGELSAEREALRIANMKGKKRTPEQRKRISEAAKKRVYKKKRKPLTEEQKRNISEGKKRNPRKITEAVRQQCREAQKKSKGFSGRKHTEESKRKTSETLRKRYGTL
jgi:hypothetical protein